MNCRRCTYLGAYEIKNREICIKPGVNANDIDKLLEIDKNIEKVDRKNLFAIYTEVSSCL